MNTIYISDEILKIRTKSEMFEIRDRISHALEKDDRLYDIYHTNEDNIINVTYKGGSFKLIIEKI